MNVLYYSHDAFQPLYASHITVGPNHTLYIASYAQSSQGDFSFPYGSLLKLHLSSDRSQVLSALKITDNGDIYSNTPYVHSQIAVDSEGNAYYTTGMHIYENNDYKGQKTGRLLKLDTNNKVTTLYIAPEGASLFEPPTLTADGVIYMPNGVVLDSSGNVLWNKPCSYAVAVDNNGHAYFATGGSVTIYKQRIGGYPSLIGNAYVSELNPPEEQLTGEQKVTLRVERLLSDEGKITIDYRTEDISAIGGLDYMPLSGTLTFEDGETSKHIVFTYYNDRVNKGDRQLKLIIENPTNCSEIPAGNVMEKTITIGEDDSTDITPPSLIFSNPIDGAVDLIPIDSISLNFDEYIIAGEGLNSITLHDGEKNISITPTIGLKNMEISIDTILSMTTNYVLTVPKNAITDPSGNFLGEDLHLSFSTVKAQFGGGDGSPENPYVVDSPKALYSIKDYPDKCYIITQDIDMGPSTSIGGDYYFEGRGWNPIPNFTGVLEGQNFTISNLKINRKDEIQNIGLFSINRGKIMNVNIHNSNIAYENTSINSSNVGLIAGYNIGLIYNCSNGQSNITFKQTKKMTNYYNGYCIGGIVGKNKGSISYCQNTATLNDESIYTTYICGVAGIAGFNDAGTIQYSYNDAEIDYPTTLAPNNRVNIGGIVGRNQGNIFDCYNNKKIQNGFAIMAMNTSEWNVPTNVERCYSISENTSFNSLDGKYVSINNIYQYNGGIEVYQRLSDWGGDPIIGNTSVYNSLDVMKQEGSYFGFDFVNIWQINEGVTVPTLQPIKPVKGLTVESNTLSLITHETKAIAAEISPRDATLSDIYYSSQNSEVASVSADGTITGIKEGVTKVSAYTLEGLHTQMLEVTVIDPSYGIAASPLTSFGTITVGYTRPPAQQVVTISNVGNQEIILQQPTSDYYDIGKLSTTTLAAIDIATFTVQPKIGLTVGSYEETLSIKGSDGALTSVALDFEVKIDPSYGIAASPLTSFGTTTVGYTRPPAQQVVTISSVGNQEIILQQPTSDYYDIGKLSTTTLAAIDIATFTVQPKIGLAVGSYEETLSIKGSDGALTSVALDFEVKIDPSYGIAASPLTSFGTTTVGYTRPPAQQVVTISNVGNQEIILQQPTSDYYDIGKLSTTTLAAIDIATFTVQPKIGLTVGSYEETLSIKGSDGALTNVNLDFEVKEVPRSNDRDTTKSEPLMTSNIFINGHIQNVGTVTRSNDGGQTITTVTLDDEALQQDIQSESNQTLVSIILRENTDSGEVVLNAQTIKVMAERECILEIKGDAAIYSLPIAKILIDRISEYFGTEVELKDIKMNIKISRASVATNRIMQETADKNKYQIVAQPIDFEITCSYAGDYMRISDFDDYIERMIPISGDMDPAQITTGIVLNNDTTFSHVPTTRVQIDGKYYAKLKSLTNSTYTVIYNPIEFIDVTGYWAKDAINEMGSRLIIKGVGDNTFKPDKEITRAEFTAILIRALGLKKNETKSSFSDVMNTSWHKGYIETAVAYNVVTGCSKDRFRPEDKITREEAMVMLYRAMELVGIDSTLSDEAIDHIIGDYSDGSTVSNYAIKGIGTCLDTDIVLGRTDGTLAPKEYITRAEVAVIIERMLLKLKLI